MTRAAVVSMIRHANVLLQNGDCRGAQQTLGQAWLALGEYSAALAQQGVSPATALSLHRSISKAMVVAGQRCADPDSLISPSGRSVRPQNPDLLAPSFRGTGDMIYNSLTTTITTLGIGAAVVGLAYGLYTVYKSS